MKNCDFEFERGVDKGPLKRVTSKYKVSYSFLGNVHHNSSRITGYPRQTPATPSPKHLPEIILSLLRRRRPIFSRGGCGGGRGTIAGRFLRTNPSSGFGGGRPRDKHVRSAFCRLPRASRLFLDRLFLRDAEHCATEDNRLGTEQQLPCLLKVCQITIHLRHGVARTDAFSSSTVA